MEARTMSYSSFIEEDEVLFRNMTLLKRILAKKQFCSKSQASACIKNASAI